MSIQGHKIENKLGVSKFLELIKNYEAKNIICTKHTLFRLSQEQRKLFKCENLKEYLIYETPILVGIQHNKKYAAFYKNKDIIRIILDIKQELIEIITFYIVEEKQVPKI